MVSEEKEHYDPHHPGSGGVDVEVVTPVDGNAEINVAGYKDQLKRQYGIWGIVGIALTVDNAWAALGSSISVSIRKLLWSSPLSMALSCTHIWNSNS